MSRRRWDRRGREESHPARVRHDLEPLRRRLPACRGTFRIMDAGIDEARFAVGLPPSLGDGGAEALHRFATRAEELDFVGLWSLDSAAGGPARTENVDGLHQLTFAAAHTTSVRVGIAVIVLPRRNPILLARELASIDQLSAGRLVVGVGIGARASSSEALGFPSDHRARRLTESIAVMRALWSDDEATFHGEIFDFTGLRLGPKPAQRPGPPIWIGAGAPNALERAVRLGDGWIGAGSAPSDAFLEQARIVRGALESEGRDPRTFPVSKRVYIAVESTEQRARERLTPMLDGMYGAPGLTERVAVCGPAEQCADELRRLFEGGADELMLHPLYDHVEQLDALGELRALVRG
jgi:probable F420-dependent oxidoreductase